MRLFMIDQPAIAPDQHVQPLVAERRSGVGQLSVIV
jgi:hypothetical protein